MSAGHNVFEVYYNQLGHGGAGHLDEARQDGLHEPPPPLGLIYRSGSGPHIYQKGLGLGTIARTAWTYLKPLIGHVGKVVGQEALSAGRQWMSDLGSIESSHSIAESAKRRAGEALDNLGSRAKTALLRRASKLAVDSGRVRQEEAGHTSSATARRATASRVDRFKQARRAYVRQRGRGKPIGRPRKNNKKPSSRRPGRQQERAAVRQDIFTKKR